MRRTLLALGWLLCPPALVAAPVPAGQSSHTTPVSQAQLQATALSYSQNLSQIVDTLERLYVRPVNRADLIEAALTGLYEAAGVPMPGTLKADIKKAAKGTGLDALVRRTRMALGNPESLQGRRALFVSARAIMRSLDPFCSVVTGEEAATATGFDQNYGLGIDLVEKTGSGPLLIKAVVPGGPAQRAGLQAGDHVVRVDDKETKDLSTREALRLLNGASAGTGLDDLPAPPPPGGGGETAPTQVRLTVQSAGKKEERKVTLLRDYFEAETVQGVTRNKDNSWDFWVDRKNHIAQVRIVYLARFSQTANELERVLTRLEGDGLRGLILDLRWCPGGYLDSATGVAGLFLEEGVIAKTSGRMEGEHVYQAGAGERTRFLRFPVMVLVGSETTGGGELIAAALQDHKRAVLAGQRTRGKGSIQTTQHVRLFGESGQIDGDLELKFTNGTFLRPNGKGLTRFTNSKLSDDWGVKPDAGLEFRISADLNRQLKEWWVQQSLRPGASTKALPLDDPDQDPQRQAAVKALLRIMAQKK